VLAETQGPEEHSLNIAGLDRCFCNSDIATFHEFDHCRFRTFAISYSSESQNSDFQTVVSEEI
jgi:hypothetical protein